MTDFVAYFENYFKEYGYEAEDAVYFTELTKKVLATPATANVLNEAEAIYINHPDFTHEEMKPLSTKLSRALALHPYTADYLVYLALLPHSEQVAEEKGVTREMWSSIAGDLRYKIEECKTVKGVRGSFVAFWFPRFFHFTCVGLGRLQFEIITLHREVNIGGRQLPNYSKVINVHIPRDGTPLSPAACDDAFAAARKYFYPQVGNAPFRCHSWLLFPKGKEFLPPKSNLRSFMERFHIYDWGYSTLADDMWRLFDTDEQNPARLPANGSLRAAYAAYLQAGNLPGWGSGIYYYEDYKE